MFLIAQAFSGQNLDSFHLVEGCLVKDGKSSPRPAVESRRVVLWGHARDCTARSLIQQLLDSFLPRCHHPAGCSYDSGVQGVQSQHLVQTPQNMAVTRPASNCESTMGPLSFSIAEQALANSAWSSLKKEFDASIC